MTQTPITHHVHAFLISAVASGQGKTTVTAALARKLVNLGQRVHVFKTGPDFLDPMILGRACGLPVDNLDLWLVGLEACQERLAQAAQNCDVILIEGVMGLYDGSPSSADLANAFGIPVMGVVDASAMAQTAGALAIGLRDYGPVNLVGVIANRVASEGHAKMIEQAMRDIPLIAWITGQASPLPERHLGLVQAAEIDDLDACLTTLADALSFNPKFNPEAWHILPKSALLAPLKTEEKSILQPLANKTIAIAQDAAFAFSYPANIVCLQELGAKLVYFSPIANEAVPSHVDAVWLPGGYPELHAEALSKADLWQNSIRAAHAANIPILAECGGMMSLATSIIDQQAHQWKMIGLLKGNMHMQKKLAAIGAQYLDTSAGQLRGHAFHYSRFETKLPSLIRSKKYPISEQLGEFIYCLGSLTATYFHAYFPSCPAAIAEIFLGKTDQLFTCVEVTKV